MRDLLDTLARWSAAGVPAAVATVVATEKSAPRGPGATLAVSADGELAGSVTGGCVEPAVIEQAREVLAGGRPRLLTYGVADADAFEVGLACGGTVHIFLSLLDAGVVEPLREAVAADRPVALVVPVDGPGAGRPRVAGPGDAVAGDLLGRGESGLVAGDGGRLFVLALAPRPRMYVFGAIDFAAALARIGRFLGYHVTVCDPRRAFLTPERIPDADRLVAEWPDRLLAAEPLDERTVVCVLTHDHRFDVPALKAALESPAAYIGAMGSRTMSRDRDARLRAEGVADADIERIHAPIGLAIGSRTPEEVAVAIAGQIIASRPAADRAGAPTLAEEAA